MTLATLSALLLFLAALLQSLSYLCNKLPETKRPKWYPGGRLGSTLLDFSWVMLCIAGLGAAFTLNLGLGIVAMAIYFLGLPFLFQSALAHLLGFKNLRALVAFIDSQT